MLVLVLAGCGRGSGTAAPAPRPAPATYTLMQMNLCLSGVAGCYRRVEYPAGVREAILHIRQTHPDAVTLNEVCRNDVAAIARHTGYHMRFSRVIYNGRPLACIHPTGRGLFGDAVLAKAPIERTESQAFAAQAGPERRVWLCVSTRIGVEVCTAHLASQQTDERAANDPQCAEPRKVLARRAAAGRTVIFGGDVNRRPSCAPRGFWTQTDISAHQDPGIQQVYGNSGLSSSSARVLRARHTDHDVLVVRAHLSAQHQPSP